jgi:hypothetical protein
MMGRKSNRALWRSGMPGVAGYGALKNAITEESSHRALVISQKGERMVYFLLFQ